MCTLITPPEILYRWLWVALKYSLVSFVLPFQRYGRAILFWRTRWRGSTQHGRIHLSQTRDRIRRSGRLRQSYLHLQHIYKGRHLKSWGLWKQLPSTSIWSRLTDPKLAAIQAFMWTESNKGNILGAVELQLQGIVCLREWSSALAAVWVYQPDFKRYILSKEPLLQINIESLNGDEGSILRLS